MKKHLSVFGLFTRSSVYKVLLILIAMCAVQSLCFYMEVQDAVAAVVSRICTEADSSR